MIEVTVYGRAKPAGALQIGHNKAGRAFLHHRGSSELNEWKNAIRDKAGDAMQPRPPYDGPVAIDAYFYFARPKSHYGSGRNASALKATAPVYPTTRANGDGDKLARALLDAITGTVIDDDSQVADLRIRKRYADHQAVRLTLTVRALDELDQLHAREEAAAV